MVYKDQVEIFDTQEESISAYTFGKIKKRFIIIEESIFSHCCLQSIVVDTKEGLSADAFDDYKWKRVMCETTYDEEAIEICHALNQLHSNK